MTCSARLPVYALLLGFVFMDQPSWKAGFALAALYMAAALVGAIAAGILNRILAVRERSLFMMELPMYRRPRLRVILKQTMTRTNSYVKRAGPMIFIFAVLIWVGSTFPHYQVQDPERLQESYLAQVGRTIEPIFRPMGVDWRVGVGLLSAFAAREVFVSSMAVMFNITGEEDAVASGMLAEMQRASFEDGQKIFTVASVVGLLVFFMIALQCMSTVGVQLRENKSWGFAIWQLVIFNVVAYVLAVICVQGLRAFGVA
jgi:ferrous iron transport protein B